MSVNSVSSKKRKDIDHYPFSDESASASYNPIDRSDYVSREAVGVPVPPVQPRGLVRESGRQIKPPTKMQKIRDVVDEVHIRLPILRGNVDGIMDEAMRRLDEIHNKKDGSLLAPGQLSEEADQSIADLQELELTLVSAQERMRELNEYVKRAQENIHRKVGETISLNYPLQQRSLQIVLDQLVNRSILFVDLDPEQKFIVINSTPVIQLQDLVRRGIIPSSELTHEQSKIMLASSSFESGASSSGRGRGRGGKTKTKRKGQTKTRKNNKQKSRH